MGFDEEFEELARALAACLNSRNVAKMKKHHPPDGIAHVSAGVGIVADIGDTVGSEGRFADFQDTFAHGGRDPGIQTMHDDVFELRGGGIEIEKVLVAQFDVGELDLIHEGLAGRNGGRRKVNPNEGAPGQGERHGDEIPGFAATEFKHTTAVYRRRLDTEEGGNGGEAIGVSLWKDLAGVAKLVVGRGHVVLRTRDGLLWPDAWRDWQGGRCAPPQRRHGRWRWGRRASGCTRASFAGWFSCRRRHSSSRFRVRGVRDPCGVRWTRYRPRNRRG